jgi:adenylate kinase family enzyme
MSRSGRFVAMAQRDAEPVHVALVDALGTAPRRRLSAAGLEDFACVGEALWLVAGGVLRRHALTDGSELAPLALADAGGEPGAGRLQPACHGQAALWLGQRSLLIREAEDGTPEALDVAGDIGSSTCVGVLGGARLALADGPLLRLRDVGRDELMRAHLPLSGSEAGEVLACHYLFGERALAVLVAGAEAGAVLVLRPDGALIHRIDVPRVATWAVAENRGRAVLYRAPAGAVAEAAQQPGRLLSVDLRYGRLLARMDAPLLLADLAVDADARYLVLAGRRPVGADVDPDDETDEAQDTDAGQADLAREDAGEAAAERPAILHLAYASIFGGAPGQPRRDLAAGANQPGAGPGASDQASEPGSASGPGQAKADTAEEASGERDESDHGAGGGETGAPALRLDAAAPTSGPASGQGGEPGLAVGPVYVPPGPLLGLGPPRRLPRVKNPPRVRPYRSADEYLESMLDLVAAQATRAIADAWDRGELSVSSAGQWPFEHAVVGLMGARPGFAAEFLESVTEELGRLARETSERMLATVARGRSLPLVELGMELGLSALQSQVLLVVAAPALRGEIARLYRILAADARRLPCDVHLVERILGGRDWRRRREIADALAPDSTLVSAGLIQRDEEHGLGAARLSVDPAVVARVRGTAVPGFALRQAERPLEALWAPEEIKRALVLALAEPPRDGSAVRVLLRGRRGSGRRTLAAALTARIGRPIADIDCAHLPRPGTAMAEALHTILCRAVIAGAVACVSGLEVLGADDAEGIAHVRAVLRAHPAPVILRASPELMPPVDPGYIEVSLPQLDETMRLAFWHEALERHGLRAADVALLAARFRVGPGSIEAAARSVADQRAYAPGSEPGTDVRQSADADADATTALDTALRQHIESRMGSNATRITRLAEWSQVTLPDDLRESVLELIARVRQRRTVYEHWGFDRKIQSARGLSALFYGPPGVGKTMVAGVIARDLGLDLYRVDLAQITSKWIGETEKNLAEVFEAGEDGQVVILFDEADSLFAKRTEVKSSVDRHANQQVNYLLQRLDTFEGVALLTTNREGSIDKAFKRRMTMRLAFPFPDEDMRARLWEAHIPADIPRAGTFDLAELARRFPLSGGYIRNCALRAAFLAAAEGVPLSYAHLVRAVELEYQEMGKLAPSGRLE